MSDEIYRNRQPEFYAPYLDRLSPIDPPLLELGAGQGLLLELARSRGIESRGLELLPDRVETCRSKGLDVKQHDLGTPLPFPDRSFGAIYCGQVIEHMPYASQKVMLREAYRVLKDDGKFLICSPCRHDEFSRSQRDHNFLLTPTELRALLTEAGFSRITEVNYPQKVPELPAEVLKEIWNKYKPDLLSETANALCLK